MATTEIENPVFFKLVAQLHEITAQLVRQHQHDLEAVVLNSDQLRSNLADKTVIYLGKGIASEEAIEVCITYHPANLPNDPPGKASNLKWAADCLLEHLWRTRTDLARIIVTVADADSEFHHKYFDILSSKYLEVPPEMRNLRIWQSPICHLKNYFRQPSPVIVGTMFTTMQVMVAMTMLVILALIELRRWCDPSGEDFDIHG